VHLAELSLTHVRTFARLEWELTPGVHVIVGANGSGKSNLLEAITLLATTRSARARSDGELVSWSALGDVAPLARAAGRVLTRSGERVSVEVAITARPAAGGGALGGEPAAAGRRFRVNGVARRASDLIGRLRVVPFSADDLAIISGAPVERRRYLDVTIAQLDAPYVRALQRYTRVLQQRNSLLRRLQERRAALHELDFWDEELARNGGALLHARAATVAALASEAAAQYAALAPDDGALACCYRPGVPSELASRLLGGASEEAIADELGAVVGAERARDVQAGVTHAGPHRDDVAIAIGGHAAATTASRGQQRTAALALRLAEVAHSLRRTGDAPVLLLDDVLSELDAARRERVLAAAFAVDQVIITTPDADRPPRAELPGARWYTLAGGVLQRAD